MEFNDKKINNALVESDYIIKSQVMFDKKCKVLSKKSELLE